VIEAVGVVVPVHDEEEHLGPCLVALGDAVRRAGAPVEVVVVLDACTDASAARAAEAVATVVTIDERNVGAARGAGAAAALAAADPARVWLATTDADSLVPPTWLADQLALAAAGADAVAGVVEVLDWAEHPPEVPERYLHGYAARAGSGHARPPATGHRHVHGANLGVRGDAYLAVGGFPPLPTGEDVALWRALVRDGRATVATRALVVTTSARRRARAPDGFAAHLRGLAG